MRSARKVRRTGRGRPLWKLMGWVAAAAAILIGSAFLGAQYLYQLPAREAIGRLAGPELAWQRGKYPSVRPLFDMLQTLFPPPSAASFGSSWMTFRPGYQSWPAKMQSSSAAERDQPICYDDRGNPLGQSSAAPLQLPGNCHYRDSRVVRAVSTPSELTAALRQEQAGTTILISPGVYRLSGHAIAIGNPGRPDAPIWVAASEPGEVTIELDTFEGFLVDQPYWIFENLEIVGVCEKDTKCEHAFHVVGRGERLVLRNDTIRNFNAPIKVNADRKNNRPDHGLIEGSRFYNDAPRQTDTSVTLIDVVAASDWVVRRNFIADFAKVYSDQTSYAAFFKGAGERGLFERNLVMCEWRHRGGTRIGLSLGGGGTIATACRDGSCEFEHKGGTIRSNVIMNCSDVGIYLNEGLDSRIFNNLLLKTRGIDARFEATSAKIANNIVDGRILARDGASVTKQSNIGSWWQAALLKKASEGLFIRPSDGDFRFRDEPRLRAAGTPIGETIEDFCGRRMPADQPPIGPFLTGVALPCPAVPE